MKIVLANGCFDIFHSGHVAHLEEAKRMGDILIVSVTLDTFVHKGQGRPVNKWWDRAAVVKACRYVDDVIPTCSAVEAIKSVKPAYFVKGTDYSGGKQFSEDVLAACREVGAEIRYTTSPKRSATEIIRMVKCAS